MMKISKLKIFPFLLILVFIFLNDVHADIKTAYQHNQKGIEALGEHNYRIAIEHFLLALRDLSGNKIIKSNLSNAYHDYGAYLLKKGELFNAQDNFKKSLAYNSKNVYSLVDLGRSYYSQNKLEKAVYYLEEARKLNSDIKGLSDLLDKIKNESQVESKLEKISTVHFIIVKDAKVHINNLANIKISLEQAYSRVGSFFDYFLPQKIPVIIYPESSYKNLNQGAPHWSHAYFDGKIRLPMADRIYDIDFLRKIIYHEFAHAVIRELTKGNIPMWLNEALACYAEGFVEYRDRSFFAGFINKNSFIGLDGLPDNYSQISDSRQANLFYREFYLLASFIVDRYGNIAVREILSSLGRGSSIDSAIKESTSLDFNEFAYSWEKYVKQRLGF